MSPAVLVIIAGDTPQTPLAWVRMQSGAIAAAGEAPSLDAVPGEGGNCILVLPGFEAQVRVLETPARSDAQARAAAAYLFKGALATSEADTAFALGQPFGKAGARQVAAIARDRLSLWLASCARSRLAPQAIYLDHAIWPVHAGSAHIVRLGDRTLVSAGVLGGFTIESDLAPALIGPWLGGLGLAVSRLELFGWSRESIAAASDFSRYEISVRDGEPVHILARAAMSPPPSSPDLARDNGPARGGSAPRLSPWWLAASLAALAALAQIGVTTLDGMRDADAARDITAAAEAAFRSARPEVKRITNLRAQVTASLNRERRVVANPVLGASQVVTGVLAGHPDVRLDEVRHDAPSPAILFRLSSEAPARLEAALAALREVSPRLELGALEAIEGRSSVAITMSAP